MSSSCCNCSATVGSFWGNHVDAEGGGGDTDGVVPSTDSKCLGLAGSTRRLNTAPGPGISPSMKVPEYFASYGGVPSERSMRSIIVRRMYTLLMIMFIIGFLTSKTVPTA